MLFLFIPIGSMFISEKTKTSSFTRVKTSSFTGEILIYFLICNSVLNTSINKVNISKNKKIDFSLHFFNKKYFMVNCFTPCLNPLYSYLKMFLNVGSFQQAVDFHKTDISQIFFVTFSLNLASSYCI